ncbi:MAG TPA: hypothetical protein VK171_10980 [Fimbriimonas sp.]|nr:hypothetical protein [Fimbriimonas sp.]
MPPTKEILAKSEYAVPTKKALAARLTLHKDATRSEEMYYYLCFDWEQLVNLLTDPVTYFATLLTPPGGNPSPKDALRAPVTACIRPAKPGMKEWVERVAKGGPGRPFTGMKADEESVVSYVASIFIGAMDLDHDGIKGMFESPAAELDTHARRVALMEGLIGIEDGWFLAEFANRTHVVTIHYFKPTTPLKTRYTKGYTESTICQIGDADFGHVHFDLDLAHDEHFEENVARYIVDLLEDDGVRQCAEMDKQTHVERGSIEPVFGADGNLNPSPERLPRKPRECKFDTEARQKDCGINLLVEGLSMTTGGMTKDTPLPTFVCSVNEAHLPNGAVVLKDGILKRYTSPGP